MSGVFCLWWVYPALSHPAAAAHLYRGVGELALVGGLQRGQRGDVAEDHSIQRSHRLSHHQGGAAQWCPETGTAFFFYWLPVSLCLFGVVIFCCITLKVSYFWFDHLSHLLMQHLIMALRELAFNLVQMYTWTEPSMNHFGGQSDDILSERSTSL